MVEFKPGRYLLGIWFLAGEDSDFMLTAWTDEDPSKGKCKWEAEYRFRYYDAEDPDNDPFSGKDRKSFYRITTDSMDEFEVLDNIHQMVGLLMDPPVKLEYEYKQKFFAPICSSDPEFIKAQLKNQPWCHMKEVSKEEYAEMQNKEGINVHSPEQEKR